MISTLDAARVKALAKELQRSSSAIGITLPLASFYESLAHESGYKDWNSFKAHLDRKSASSGERGLVAYAMLTWRGGEIMHSLDASGMYEAPVQLARRVQAKSKFSFEGLEPRFTRLDRPGLPRPPMPPLLCTAASSDDAASIDSLTDAWPADVTTIPQLGDCTPFRVDFWSDREERPIASGALWFLTSYQHLNDVRWSFGLSGQISSVSPIYRFLEELRQAPVERRSVIRFEVRGGKPSLLKFVEGQRTPQMHIVPIKAATPDTAAEINHQQNVSRMDKLDIMRAFQEAEWDDDVGEVYA